MLRSYVQINCYFDLTPRLTSNTVSQLRGQIAARCHKSSSSDKMAIFCDCNRNRNASTYFKFHETPSGGKDLPVPDRRTRQGQQSIPQPTCGQTNKQLSTSNSSTFHLPSAIHDSLRVFPNLFHFSNSLYWSTACHRTHLESPKPMLLNLS
jgi:hypothetical protein